ncbi:MAG: hypothetical protein JNM94_14640 [Phycisphaerae bacterium]|nr:hypothetical protein [Phycisphaerae bacterium]
MKPCGPNLAIVVSPRAMAEEGAVVRRAAAAMVADGASIVLFEPKPRRDPDALDAAYERTERRFELPRRATYDPEVPFWLRRARREAMAEAGERVAPDLVWAYGGDAWDVALALAEEIDRPAALAFRREPELRLAPKALRNDRAIAVVAPCGALADRARTVVPEQFVRVVPIGVRLSDEPGEPRAIRRVRGPLLGNAEMAPSAPVVAILVEGGMSAEVRFALRACRNAVDRVPDLEVLLECDAGGSKETWNAARSLGLLSHTTAITRGDLTVAAIDAASLVLFPEPAGGPRLETLLALGNGVPVIAAADPYSDLLVDGETAVVIGGGGTDRPTDARTLERLWTECVAGALLHPEGTAPLATRASLAVRELHRSSIAAETWLTTAGYLAEGNSLRFSPHTPPTPRFQE